jgi:hypothetical protein
LAPPVAAPSRPVFPRSRPLVEPISRADAGFFGSAGFYVRVSIFGALALLLFGILGLRLWSLEVIQGPRYAVAAKQQTFRFVNLPTARAPIVDRDGHILAGTDGRVALVADTAALGQLAPRPLRAGLRMDRFRSRYPHVPVLTAEAALRTLRAQMEAAHAGTAVAE